MRKLYGIIGSVKLHLTMTCLVTNIRRDGSVSSNDRFDMLRRSLESLRRIELHSASFFIELGQDLQHKSGELSNLLNELFPRARVHESRLSNYSEWRTEIDDTLSESPTLVLLITYEDHMLLSGAMPEFLNMCQRLEAANAVGSEEHIFSILSHIPELHVQADWWGAIGFERKLGDRSLIPAVTPIGCLLVAPQIMNEWFFDDFTGGARIVSTENYFGKSVVDKVAFSLVPNREIFTHIDGYSHVGIPELKNKESGDGNLFLRGKSFTKTSFTRVSGANLRGYLSTLKVHEPRRQLRLMARSTFFMVTHWLNASRFMTSAHLCAMRRWPVLYQQAGSAFSHGVMRYPLVVLRDAVIKLLKLIPLRNSERHQGKPVE